MAPKLSVNRINSYVEKFATDNKGCKCALRSKLHFEFVTFFSNSNI